MRKPVIIVDPLSSGIELAPAFRQRGIPCIAVSTFDPLTSLGYGTRIQTEDFERIIKFRAGEEEADLVETLKDLSPLAILPGTDAAIPLAERLAAALTPGFANDPGLQRARLHKALMQSRLEECGIPALGTLSSKDEREAERWIQAKGLANSPLIVKPAISAGSDKVFHIPGGGDWKTAFKRVLTEPSKTTGRRNESAVVQEQAVGTEYAFGTVSANGEHFLAHIIKYTKGAPGEPSTVYDFVEFVPLDEALHESYAYVKRVLDALGVKWGASHTEIMLTAKGPRLIETSPRMCGGPVVLFAREASGSSQADKLVEAIADRAVTSREFTWKKTVMPVFLRAKATGTVSNVSALDPAMDLPTLFRKFVWLKDGDAVKETVDYLSSVGIIALSGNRDEALRDKRKIREMEARLLIR